MLSSIFNTCRRVAHWVKSALMQRTRPVTGTLALGLCSDAIRSRKHLLVENALLRQQVIILARSVKQPKITVRDRLRLVLLAGFTSFWQAAIHIVQPDTILRWHRDLFRRYWRWKSRPKHRKPRIAQSTIELIQQMARDNHGWGAERIRGELLKLGIKVGKPTIQKYMKRVRQRAHRQGQTWSTFLRNHAHEI